MLTVDEYGRIRIAHRDGMSIRQIARRLRISSRKTMGYPIYGESHPPDLSVLHQQGGLAAGRRERHPRQKSENVHSSQPTTLTHHALCRGPGIAATDCSEAGGTSQSQDHLRLPVCLSRKDGPGLRRGSQGLRRPSTAGNLCRVTPQLSLFRDCGSCFGGAKFQNWAQM